MSESAARPTLLVVEDDAAVRRFLHRLLSPLAEVVDSTHRIEETAPPRAGGPFDLVIVDLDSPGRDGLAPVRACRAALDPLPIPILALATDASALQRQRAIAAGATDLLGKPDSFEHLRPLVRSMLAAGI